MKDDYLIYAVGVGKLIHEDELRSIATDKETVYFTRDYDSISKLKSSLLGRICKNANPRNKVDPTEKNEKTEVRKLNFMT